MLGLFSLEYPVFILPPGHDPIYRFVSFVYYLVALVFVFLPFIFVIKKWKPVAWWKMAGAMVVTFLLHVFLDWKITDPIEVWLDSYVRGGNYLSQFIGSHSIPFSFLVSLLLILSPFLSVWVIYGRYTWLRFFAALGSALVIASGVLLFYYWVLITGARMLIERFN